MINFSNKKTMKTISTVIVVLLAISLVVGLLATF